MRKFAENLFGMRRTCLLRYGMRQKIFILAACVWALLATACVDEKFTDDPTAVLTFSCDTLSFDTMFTNVPSRTLSFYVYNRNDKALKISSVRLGRGGESYFRYNLDGRIPPDNKMLENVEIKAKDSLFVFVEMTADRNEVDFPVYYLDSMLFVTNGVTQNVKLVVYGQDAVVLDAYTLAKNQTLTAERPYLIFDYMYVPEDVTLTLAAGARLYFHDKANLVVDGHLVAQGTPEQPVLMRTDRFDRMPDEDLTPYDYMPGQWGGVYLQNAHGRHTLTHTHIRGCDAGVVVSGTAIAQPSLKLTNCILHTMTQYGLFAQNANVEVVNCELSNCGTACFYQLGGEAYVAHTTIANYYTWGTRQDVAMVIANYYVDGNLLYLFPVKSAVVENSIVFGNQSREIALLRDTITDAAYNVTISHSLLKCRRQTDAYFVDNYWANSQNPDADGVYHADTVFVNTSIRDIAQTGYFDFRLADRSSACGKADVAVAERYPTDLEGKNRLSDGAPDLGAYEK